MQTLHEQIGRSKQQALEHRRAERELCLGVIFFFFSFF